jgi:hypothetical protein
LSVEAVHVRRKEFAVNPEAARLVGAVGEVTSVETDNAVLCAELFPAASLAETVIEYVVFAVNPVTANEVVDGLPMDVPFL